MAAFGGYKIGDRVVSLAAAQAESLEQSVREASNFESGILPFGVAPVFKLVSKTAYFTGESVTGYTSLK